MAQGLVLGWLQDIASNGEKFRELQDQGKERIGRQIGEMREAVGRLEIELKGVKEQIETRIQELTRTRAEPVRESIEQSIIALERERKEAQERTALVNHTISEIESIIAEDGDLYADYRKRIQEALVSAESGQKMVPQGLIASLLLQEGGVKIALSSITRKAPCSSVFVPSPPIGRA